MANEKTAADRLEHRLDESINRHNRSQKITLVLGVVLIVIIVAYLGILGSRVKGLSEPDSVSDIAVGYAEERLPELSKSITTELKTNAENYVNQGFDLLIENIPSIRERLEGFSKEEFRSQLVQVRGEVYELADYTIEKHEDNVRQMLVLLESNESTEEFEHELYDLLTEPLEESQAQVDLKAYAIALQEMADKVEKLNKNEGLTESEKIEREVLVALKELSNRSDKQVDLELPKTP